MNVFNRVSNLHKVIVVLYEGVCDHESVVNCKQKGKPIMYEDLEKSRFISACISDMQNILYVKILTLLYEPCHFMTIVHR